MLQTRLWMGAVLIALVAGVLVVDQWLAPWFPFLFLLIAGLALAATLELLHLLKPSARPPGWLCLVGIGGLVVANWLPHVPWWPFDRSVSALLVGVLAALVIAVLLVEMTAFKEPGQSVA